MGECRYVRNDNDVLTAFEFHDDGFQTDHDVAVRLAASVAVIVLVVVARLEIFGVFLGDFLVLRQMSANTVTRAGV